MGFSFDMNKLEEMSLRRKQAHATLLATKSKVYAGFLAMEKAAYTDGALPKKQKELIAVGISVVKVCESCMQWHIEQAAASGASFDELLEAIEVEIEMGGGPATVSARFALEVMEGLGMMGRKTWPETANDSTWTARIHKPPFRARDRTISPPVI
jgi:AhpD family alkylhydroperoxidase